MDQRSERTAEYAVANSTTADADMDGSIVAGSPSAGRPVRIVSATVEDLHAVISDHSRYWGERDLRSLHLIAMVQEFPSTCLVATADDGIRGYIFGFVTPDGVAYVHLIATREDARGDGLGRRLYEAFMDAGRGQGAHRLKAITSVANEGSIAFHRRLGFEVRIVENYNGPGQTRVVFTRSIDKP